MKGHPWQICHCYPDAGCPNHTLIDKAYLIPQFLTRSELAVIKTKCATCDLRRTNRRRHRRVERQLNVAIFDEGASREVRGITLNLSKLGALIKVGNGTAFQANQRVRLRLFDEEGNCALRRAVITRFDSAKSAVSVRLLRGL
jgi:c-di-GMP-binding flagellar brake protein YcgR